MKCPTVYILASRPHGALYIGVTSNLAERVRVHRSSEGEGFTARFRVHRLVHFEEFETMTGAIRREKALKHWRRAWKITLIETDNPYWLDLLPKYGDRE